MKKVILLILLGLCSEIGLARPVAKRSTRKVQPKSTSIMKQLNFNLGTHTEFYGGIQNDTSGGTRKFDLAPTIGLGTRIQLGQSLFSVLPEVNWVLPHFNEDSKIMKNTFMLRGDLGLDLLSWLRLRLGTSIMWLNQQGRGGSTQIDNGNTQSTFYYPDENRTSLNNTLDAGAEFILDQFALRLQTYTYAIFDNQRKQISYSLFLSYYWDR